MDRHRLTLTILSVLAMSAVGRAAEYRIYFRGSEAVARQSASMPRPAGYAGVPTGPGDLSASCATCVPGGAAAPYFGAGTPNQIVTFLHPYTNQAVTIPLTLPMGRPTIVTKSDRIVYNYGLFSYRVVVRFLSDGRVEVRYIG